MVRAMYSWCRVSLWEWSIPLYPNFNFRLYLDAVVSNSKIDTDIKYPTCCGEPHFRRCAGQLAKTNEMATRADWRKPTELFRLIRQVSPSSRTCCVSCRQSKRFHPRFRSRCKSTCHRCTTCNNKMQKNAIVNGSYTPQAWKLIRSAMTTTLKV